MHCHHFACFPVDISRVFTCSSINIHFIHVRHFVCKGSERKEIHNAANCIKSQGTSVMCQRPLSANFFALVIFATERRVSKLCLNYTRTIHRAREESDYENLHWLDLACKSMAPIYLLCFKLHSIKRHDRLVMTTIH